MTLPLLMLLLLFGLDFGRVFLGYMNLNNVVKVAATYAAKYPNAWGSAPNLTEQAEYDRLVNADAAGTNCTLPSPVPTPTFPSGKDIGSPVTVGVTCRFNLITPIIGAIVGNVLNVSASATYPVQAGVINGITVSGLPLPTPTPTPIATPAPTPTPGPTPTPTPIPNCTVPNLTNDRTNNVQADWSRAGFTGPIIFNPLVPPDYRIRVQTTPIGAVEPCNSGIEVRP